MLLILTCISVLFGQLDGHQMLSAEFNIPDLLGAIVFSQKSPFDQVSIQVQLLGDLIMKNQLQWELHNFPVLHDSAEEESVCYDSSVGSCILNGNLTESHGLLSKRLALYDNAITLYGRNSIYGSSLVLYSMKGEPIACSNVLPFNKPVVTYRAQFHNVLGGEIFFTFGRQIESMIYGSLAYVDNTTYPTFDHLWYIDEQGYVNNNTCQVSGRVFGFGEASLYAHCSEHEPHNCLEGDLSSKVGPIRIGAAGTPKVERLFNALDAGFNLNAALSLNRRILVIKQKDNSDSLLACAEIEIIPTSELQARLVVAGKSSVEVRLEQVSPLHLTTVSVTRDADDHSISYLSVHEQPTDHITGRPCSSTGRKLGLGSMLNGDLLGRNTSQVSSGRATDKFKKHLVLRGIHSVVGRAVVMRRKDTEEEVCADLILRTSRTIELIAIFNETTILNGYVYMSQSLDKYGTASGTVVLIDLSYAGSANGNVTHMHGWHVHDNSVQNDSLKPLDERCKSTGNHYNPYLVDIKQPLYGQQCSKNFVWRCEVGDLNNKHEFYDIGGGRRFYVDPNLPLSGPHTGQIHKCTNPSRMSPRTRGSGPLSNQSGPAHNRKVVILTTPS